MIKLFNENIFNRFNIFKKRFDESYNKLDSDLEEYPKIIETVEHQNIGGRRFIPEFEISKEECLKCDNYATMNFVLRRDDFTEDFKYKLYYGHVKQGNDSYLGYVVAEDELEGDVGNVKKYR